MFIKYFLFTCYFILVLSNASDCENCTYLQNDYDTLYNTSLNLYQECISQLDNTLEQYENELLTTDLCMEELKICESNTTDLKNTVNYTNQIKILKHNIELESSLLSLKKKLLNMEEKNNIAYTLINDYKEEISKLKYTYTDTIHQLYAADANWNQCKLDLETQIKTYNKIFTNLNACLEREELSIDQKNKYIISLTTCRKKNDKKNKKKYTH